MNLFAPLTNLFLPRDERERRATLAALEGQLKRATAKLQEAYDDARTWRDEMDEYRRMAALAGRRGARKDGDSWPLLRTMEDLTRFRTESREAVDGNGYGAGMLDRAIDFVIGDGMQPEITLRGPKKGAVATGVADADGDGRPDADPAVGAVQGVVDEFRRLNDWGCGEEDREEEGFRRSQRDGETGVRFFAGDAGTNGVPLVRWVEPEQVDAPPGALPTERWGIRYRAGDVETRLAYYLYDLDGTAGEWVDAREIVWHKLGTDRTVLRGMPQFWLVAQALSQSDKLNSAVTEVSAIQAQIAYVRQHAAGVLPGQITDFVGGTGDGLGRKATPFGDKYRRVGYGENGTVVDMSAGMTFQAGPVSQGVPGFVAALQSRLRQVCARFGYPEFFTGDASNGNYASLLAAGGPAERAFKRRQMKYASFQAAVYRRACEYAVTAGRLSAGDLAAVEIKVKPGKVSVSNSLEEAQIDQIMIQNKVKSVQTVMAERGLDPRVESANLEAWDAKFGAGAMGLGGTGGGTGGGPGDPFGGGFADATTGESYTPDEYALLSEADRSHLVRKVITNSKGRKQVVWVRANPDDTTTKTRQQVADARTLVATAVADPNRLNPEQLAALAEHLETVNRDEIRNLLKQVGEKVGGQKAELAARLVERVKAGRTAGVGDALARDDAGTDAAGGTADRLRQSRPGGNGRLAGGVEGIEPPVAGDDRGRSQPGGNSADMSRTATGGGGTGVTSAAGPQLASSALRSAFGSATPTGNPEDPHEVQADFAGRRVVSTYDPDADAVKIDFFHAGTDDPDEGLKIAGGVQSGSVEMARKVRQMAVAVKNAGKNIKYVTDARRHAAYSRMMIAAGFALAKTQQDPEYTNGQLTYLWTPNTTSQNPTTAVDKPATAGNTTPVQPQSAGANQGDGGMSDTERIEKYRSSPPEGFSVAGGGVSGPLKLRSGETGWSVTIWDGEYVVADMRGKMLAKYRSLDSAITHAATGEEQHGGTTDRPAAGRYAIINDKWIDQQRSIAGVIADPEKRAAKLAEIDAAERQHAATLSALDAAGYIRNRYPFTAKNGNRIQGGFGWAVKRDGKWVNLTNGEAVAELNAKGGAQ